MGLKYEKWEGTGNDFVLVDGRQAGVLPSDWDPAEIERICDREQGVGADGVLVVKGWMWDGDDAEEEEVRMHAVEGTWDKDAVEAVLLRYTYCVRKG